MDESALLSALKSLDARWSVLELWLWVCACAVVVGVAIEVCVVILEWRHDWRDFRRGTIPSPQKPANFKYVLELLGSVLVVLGVLGELLVGVAGGRVETEMRGKTRILVSIIDGKTKEANGRAVELEQEVEVEKRARVEIEDRVAWRRLTKVQISEMGSVLAAFPRQLTALVYNAADLEAYGFACDIDVALHEFAKWNVGEPQAVIEMREGPVKFGTNPPLERGVVVRSTSDKQSRDAANAVIHELSVRGFDAIRGEPINNSRSMVEIFVEPRPEGPQGDAKLRAQKKGTKAKPTAIR